MTKKNQSVFTRLKDFSFKLKNTGKSIECKFEKFEKKLDDTAKSVDKTFEDFEKKLEKKTERLDKWFESAEEKLEFVLETDGLKKHFKTSSGRNATDACIVKAVDGVDIGVIRGETLGIVGESGCGKSTIARMMIGLIPPSNGSIRLLGEDLNECSKEARRAIRRRTGIVFQDPYGSLNPRMNVAEIISEPLRAYKLYENKTDMLLKSLEILEACGMNADDLFKFPHQFSGGQRQRICIARALVASPEIVVCDEVVSALDVSIQAQIINLLCDLRDSLGLTYIFISHDLDVVRFIADRVAVMYLGKVVEIAPKDELFNNPRHPYTASLLEAAPVFGRRYDDSLDLDSNSGDYTYDATNTCGCSYYARCSRALPECAESIPQLRMGSEGHAVACHRFCADMEEDDE